MQTLIRNVNWNGYLLLYIFLLIINVIFVWWVKYFPTQDGPSHIYNLFIYYDLANGGSHFDMYVERRSLFSLNMGFFVIAYPLLYIF